MNPDQRALMEAYVDAFGGHLLTSVFNGLFPVVAIALLAGGLVWLGAVFGASARPASLFRMAVFFGVVGAGLGLMLGASREPAVNAFLPALVAALSGLFIYAFPREVAAHRIELTMTAEEEAEAPKLVRDYVIAGLAGLILASTTGAFWGHSLRSVTEQDDRRYAEWLRNYEVIELPIQAEVLRQQLNLPPPATE